MKKEFSYLEILKGFYREHQTNQPSTCHSYFSFDFIFIIYLII